jgi:hypothetical protein
MKRCVDLHYSFSYWVHENRNFRIPWFVSRISTKGIYILCLRLVKTILNIYRNVQNLMLYLSSLCTVTTEGVADSWSNTTVSFWVRSDIKVSFWNLKYSSKSCSGQTVQVQQNGNLWTTWFFVCKGAVNC